MVGMVILHKSDHRSLYGQKKKKKCEILHLLRAVGVGERDICSVLPELQLFARIWAGGEGLYVHILIGLQLMKHMCTKLSMW